MSFQKFDKEAIWSGYGLKNGRGNKSFKCKKAKQESDISVKLIKENIVLFSCVLSRMFNFYIDKASFPNSLKQADITPVHKKNDTNDKTNYRPVSILPSLSKAFKKCLYDQI